LWHPLVENTGLEVNRSEVCVKQALFMVDPQYML